MQKNENNYPIDFVIIWVDGNDPEWLEERNKYKPELNTDVRTCRYRDWDNLHYWFRGVEKFAPWVNNIYFVTWGHLPEWLNINHPKLKIIKHEDYIPKKYLPTFSANPIELNLHRIKGLSEHFVFFNDDTFIIKKSRRDDFFIKGKPSDFAVLGVHYYTEDTVFHFAAHRATGIINKHFNFKKVIFKNFKGWFNFKYGFNLLKTLILLKVPYFPGIWQHHLPSSFCKSTFETLWEKEYDNLNETCERKFRHKLDFNQWLFRNWQLATGNFIPRKTNIGKSFDLHKENDLIKTTSYIKKQKGKMICINDGDLSQDEYEKYKIAVNESFEKILPEKSKFEL